MFFTKSNRVKISELDFQCSGQEEQLLIKSLLFKW